MTTTERHARIALNQRHALTVEAIAQYEATIEAETIKEQMRIVKADRDLSEGQRNYKLAQLETALRQANKEN